ncbi:hypothetical protein B0H17DRAFT_1179593, partial [Mycena rosella]
MSEYVPAILLSLASIVYAIYGASPLVATTTLIQRMVYHPQVAELLRFIFLGFNILPGTIVEAGRILGHTLMDVGTSSKTVKAEFSTGDFAYDWVLNYLENHRVWNESRSFKVVARSAASRPNQPSSLGRIDGHPDLIYEPAPATPSLFRWKGYWISVNKSVAGYSHYDTGEESRNRQILDNFVIAAREFYITSKVLPRRVDREKEPRCANAVQDAMEFTISTTQSDLGWGTGPNDTVRYMPAHDAKQQFLFKSPNTGRSTWLHSKVISYLSCILETTVQLTLPVIVAPGAPNWNTNTATGGSITITLHSSDREVLADLIDCAHKKYLENGMSRITVHLTDNRGEWAKTVTKSRRALTTLILPSDIKETLIADAREFLANGEPGTGKSSTIHALAGELGLEIYFISLASPGIDDYSLAKLISDTPSRCILLIEDDGDEEEEEPILDKEGEP